MTANLPALRDDTVIARLEAARTALAEADTIQKTKTIADVAAAAAIWAKRHHLGKEAVAYAQSVEIEAFRRMGEQLLDTELHQGGRPEKTGTKSEPVSAPTLKDLGITKKESSIAQKLAALPDKDFEAIRDGHKSMGAALAKAAEKKANPPKPKAVIAGREVEKLYEGAKRELVDLQGKYADLLEKNTELGDTARELRDSLTMFETTEPDKQQKLIVELQKKLQRKDGEIARLNGDVSHWKNKCNALIRQVNGLQKKKG